MLSIYEERQRAMDSGAAGLIAKPVDANRLRAALRTAMENPMPPALRRAAG
jgi:hypothetical protein